MKAAGIDPAIIHAFEKTDGLLVTEENKHLISDKDLAAWDAAIREYEEQPQDETRAGGIRWNESNEMGRDCPCWPFWKGKPPKQSTGEKTHDGQKNPKSRTSLPEPG